MSQTYSSSAEQAGLRPLLLEPILNSYAILFFARRPALGAALLATTFLSPLFGLFGLAGVLTALVGARLLSFHEDSIRSGRLLFNSLLTALGLAYLTRFHPVPPALLTVLLPAASLLALLLSVALGHLTRQFFGLPALSLPFVGATVMLFFLFYSFTSTPVLGSAPFYLLPEPKPLPYAVALFLQSLGMTFFLPHVLVGAAIFAALLTYSRLLLLLAITGFAAGMAFLHLTGLSTASLGVGWLGTNFVFCGIALGGMFFVPARASLLLSGIGAVFCALLAIGMQTFLRNFNIPPLSLPFNLVVLLVLFALRRREQFRFLFENPYLEVKPEVGFRLFHSYWHRFPHAHLPGLFLPFTGERVVTQGFHGKLTHQGSFAHALDFEVLDANGQPLPPQRTRLEDTYTFGTPVLAPCDGTVVRAVGHVADNPLGEQNLRENWGNLVTILTDLGSYLTVCHFKQQGVIVFQGQRVYCGQLLGYCGNSGRSLLPHLHLQRQTDASVGTATLPFCMRNYVTTDGKNGRSFRLSGVPDQGTHLAPMTFDPQLAACFESAPALRVHYRIHADGKPPRRETIAATSTPWGDRFYHSVEHRALLRASVAGGVFTVLGFEGPVESLLSSVWLALSVLPLHREPGLSWEDSFDPRPFYSRGRGWAADLLEPFTGIKFVTLRRRFHDGAATGIPIVTTEIVLPAHAQSSRLPRRIEAQLTPEDGLVQLIVTMTTGTVRITQEAREIVS